MARKEYTEKLMLGGYKTKLYDSSKGRSVEGVTTAKFEKSEKSAFLRKSKNLDVVRV